MGDPDDSARRRGATRLRIYGVVQGVGFRFFVARRAAEARLDGWVRNRSDGSVEVWAEGLEGALEIFVRAVREGPPGARVARVDRERVDPSGRFRGFEIVHGEA